VRWHHTHGKSVIKGAGFKRELNAAGGGGVGNTVRDAASGGGSVGECCGGDGLKRVKSNTADGGEGVRRGEWHHEQHHN
jgi:hypothetical protein